MRRRLMVSIPLVAAFALAAAAQAPKPRLGAAPGDHPVRATLVAEHTSIGQGLGTRVGVLFEMEPGWHIYAQVPGDAGLPTTIALEGEPPLQIGPAQWPTPEEFLEAGEVKTFGYTGTLLVASELGIPLGMVLDRPLPETFTVRANVEWLACKEICIPGKAQLELSLPVSTDPPVLSTHAQLFEHTR